jgi:membrane protease YdiL (CAAX protease family)
LATAIDPQRERLAQAMLRHASGREIALVLGVPSALSISSAIAWHFRRAGTTPFTDINLLVSLAVQLVFAAVLVRYLARRQWRPADVAGPPEPFDLARGLGLWAGMIGFFLLEMMVLSLAAPALVAPLRTNPLAGHLSPIVAVAAAIWDPIFEEFFFLGYAVPALGNRFGIRAAFVISVLLRVAAHAYQGRLAIIAILPVALVLTTYYVRTGKLWPVIVAHILQDSIALSLMGAS